MHILIPHAIGGNGLLQVSIIVKIDSRIHASLYKRKASEQSQFWWLSISWYKEDDYYNQMSGTVNSEEIALVNFLRFLGGLASDAKLRFAMISDATLSV